MRRAASGGGTATTSRLAVTVTQSAVTTYFGSKAASPTSFVLQRWNNEAYTRGGPVSIGAPGVLTQYGPALRAPVGGIHWAGTETAIHWMGFMDGAVRSGERVAKEVLAVL